MPHVSKIYNKRPCLQRDEPALSSGDGFRGARHVGARVRSGRTGAAHSPRPPQAELRGGGRLAWPRPHLHHPPQPVPLSPALCLHPSLHLSCPLGGHEAHLCPTLKGRVLGPGHTAPPPLLPAGSPPLLTRGAPPPFPHAHQAQGATSSGSSGRSRPRGQAGSHFWTSDDPNPSEDTPFAHSRPASPHTPATLRPHFCSL